MNEKKDMGFWIKVLITVEPTNQYIHIYYSYNMFAMKEVCSGNKLKLTKKVNVQFFYFIHSRGWYLCKYIVHTKVL